MQSEETSADEARPDASEDLLCSDELPATGLEHALNFVFAGHKRRHFLQSLLTLAAKRQTQSSQRMEPKVHAFIRVSLDELQLLRPDLLSLIREVD